MHSEVAERLKTLRRLPDHIVLSIATRPIVMDDCDKCICGRALREEAAAVLNDDAETVGRFALKRKDADKDTPGLCQARFGGEYMGWNRLFYSCNPTETEYVEEAFARRVAECVRA